MILPNTYFCNRMASACGLNKALAVSNTHGDDGIYFCVSKRVTNKSLSKMLIRWKSDTSCFFLGADIIGIHDADSEEGKRCQQNLHARPWDDLDDHHGGSVIHISNLKLVEPSKEVLNIRHIQSCKYIVT